MYQYMVDKKRVDLVKGYVFRNVYFSYLFNYVTVCNRSCLNMFPYICLISYISCQTTILPLKLIYN